MSSQLPTIVCIIFGIISWYYFNKFLESEREYSKLHKRFDNLHIENQKMRTRVKDLQSYKTDVSKTFQILDNELVMINDHLKRRSDRGGNINSNLQNQNPLRNAGTNFAPNSSIPIHTTIQTSRIPLTRISSFANMPSGNNVSLLTPELLTSLFNMNTEDLRQQPLPQQQAPQQQLPQQPLPQQQAPQQQAPQQQAPQQQAPQQQAPPQQAQQQAQQQALQQQELVEQSYVQQEEQIQKEEQVYQEDDNVMGEDIEREDRFDGGLQFTSSYDVSSGDNSRYDQYLLNN